VSCTARPSRRLSLPVTVASAVSGDQTIVFDLGLLRASKVRKLSLLMTLPSDKIHLYEASSPL
jgi:hypothetical protein